MKEKVKDTKKSKMPVPENTEALEKVKKVKKEMEAYYKKNKLDPSKDYTKDKKHGPIISKWLQILEINRKKVEDSTPKEIHHKKSEDKNKKPKAENVKKLPKDSRKITKYEYPLVDGKEMTNDEKKRYRMKMRKEAKEGTITSKSPEQPSKKVKEEKVKGKEKKVLKEKKTEKTEKKDKKKKKVKKAND